MCIYLTTRHVYRDGRPDSVTAEWELCSSSTGNQPCSNSQRRERIVPAQRHKRNTTIGSIATDSTTSSKGPATPASSSRGEPSVLGSSVGQRSTPSPLNSDALDRWSPLTEDANVETRRPSRSPSRRHRKYRMSIDATLGPDKGKKPLVVQPSSSSSGASSRRLPTLSTVGRLSPAHSPLHSDSNDDDTKDKDTVSSSARAEAAEILRREDRDRRRGRNQQHASRPTTRDSDDLFDPRLTASQERREHEEQMWDAHEQRTAARLDIREQIRQENRRKNWEEDERARRASLLSSHANEVLADARLAREMAELEVEEGVQEYNQLMEDQLQARKAVLEQRIAIAEIERQKAEGGTASDVARREAEDVEQRRRLRDQIRQGRERELQEHSQRLPRMDRFKALAHGRRSSIHSDSRQRATELRARIEASEQSLNELEARMDERREKEAQRQRQIRHLERKIEALDLKIEAKRAASKSKAAKEAASSRRRSSHVPIVEPVEEQSGSESKKGKGPRNSYRVSFTRESNSREGSGSQTSSTRRRGSPSRKPKKGRVSFPDQ